MAIKAVIGCKNGKSYQKEFSQEESESLNARVLGEEFDGSIVGFSGVTFQITGGSDAEGFPMRKDLNGTNRKQILLAKGVGFKGKLRKKRFGGLRVKKTIAGNTVYKKTHQLNLKVVKGDEVVEKAFAPQEEAEKKSE
ncbi:MAG: 30S ribosomal protein S6e [Candidatus Woesearchaeota archaeon]|nr:MAG: 30S ribosomal protein S6e [Candidatus Woesearchaeota archaeon]